MQPAPETLDHDPRAELEVLDRHERPGIDEGAQPVPMSPIIPHGRAVA
jgi:hypothetical protein